MFTMAPFDFFNQPEEKQALEKVHKTGCVRDRWILVAAGAASARKEGEVLVRGLLVLFQPSSSCSSTLSAPPPS